MIRDMSNPFPPVDESDLTIVPIAKSETIPSSWYVDPQFHEFEQHAIFSKSWQLVGHSGRLQNPGDYLTGTVADNPVILVCGKDQKIRSFYNVCRHRGGPLAMDDSGSCTMLQCKYHGWTYQLDGSLRGVPRFDRVELFDPGNYGLIPLDHDEWEGLIFIRLGGEKNPLKTILSGIRERISPQTLANKKFHSRVVYDISCNWKVYVDNYLEGYHLPFVHPELCELLDYGQYKTEVFERYSLQHSPTTGTGNLYGESGTAFYYFIFPNLMLNILPRRLQTNLVVPVSHNKTRVLFDYYYDDTTSPDARRLIADDLSSSDKIQQEDIGICEQVQKGLNSFAYHKGRFSVDMEQGVYHFQTLLKAAYRSSLRK